MNEFNKVTQIMRSITGNYVVSYSVYCKSQGWILSRSHYWCSLRNAVRVGMCECVYIYICVRNRNLRTHARAHTHSLFSLYLSLLLFQRRNFWTKFNLVIFNIALRNSLAFTSYVIHSARTESHAEKGRMHRFMCVEFVFIVKHNNIRLLLPHLLHVIRSRRHLSEYPSAVRNGSSRRGSSIPNEIRMMSC